MAKQTSEFHPIGFRNVGVLMTPADGTVALQIFPAGPDDSTVNQATICNAATVDVDVEILFSDGGTDYLLATVTVPASAGVAGWVPPVDLLALPCVYNASILMQAGWSIMARAKTTLTGNLTFVVVATDY